jgi:hypothetical protein
MSYDSGRNRVIPTWRDFEVFMQLLPRSSTAERMNPYTSFWTGTSEGNGPEESTWSSSTTAARTCSTTRSGARP